MGDLEEGVIASAASRSPALAAELLQKLDPKKRRELMGIATYVLNRIGADPFTWFANQVAVDPALVDFGSDSANDVEFMMRWLVSSDPLRALEMISTLPETSQPALRQAALESWSYSHPDSFLDWLATHP